MSDPDSRTWAMLAHLSSIIASFLGGMAFLGPLIVWLIFRERSSYVDYHGKEALNFQILMSIVIIGGVILGVVTCGLGFAVFPVIVVIDVVFVVIAAIKANNGEYYKYPFNWRIVK
ncbi:DUF4870 domain-containing protein [Siphonobacter sp. SORGH_AS_0500]|uniref:DUF4870 domain-containing protein n=1 Tax=Siphonobacter sp. SORGH_AS_0500 TaxID=1864824 RepID=UPI001E580F85|nr:DUF4870 domain-containing protein [Siphonobacter sp. SORGH_AS_0500]